jgi:hypothetical protein
VRRRLYCLHLMLIMTIETVCRGHTDTRQYDWARGQLTDVMALFGRFSGERTICWVTGGPATRFPT